MNNFWPNGILKIKTAKNICNSKPIPIVLPGWYDFPPMQETNITRDTAKTNKLIKQTLFITTLLLLFFRTTF